MAIDFEIEGGKRLRLLAARLEEAGNGNLKRSLFKEMREAAAPMVTAVRASIWEIPSEHGKFGHHPGSHLRTRLSKATWADTFVYGNEVHLKVRVDGRRMPAGQGRLPAYMDGDRPRWRHPVFGHEDRWVTQSAHPFFDRAMRPKNQKVINRLNEIAKEYSFKLSG